LLIAAAVRVVHGDRGDPAREHVDRYDGQHLSEDCRNQERMATASTSTHPVPHVLSMGQADSDNLNFI